MKPIHVSILLVFAAAMRCAADVPDPGPPPTDPGWYDPALPDLDPASAANTQQAESSPPTGTADSQAQADVLAEAVTPEIQALARGLENNPMRIFNYVHDKIRHVLYFGSKKGAQLTLLERSGNDFDQCALLMALLRAAGYSNAVYQFGWMGVPFDSPPSNYDLRHWLGLDLVNTNWSSTTNFLAHLFVRRGYPSWDVLSPDDHNTFIIQRVWVVLSVGADTYYLDPSFKITDPVTGLTNLPAALGPGSPSAISNALMSAAGGTTTSISVSNLNEASLRGTLTSYTTNLLHYLQTNSPNASVAEVLGGRSDYNYFYPGYDTNMPTGLWFWTYSYQNPNGGTDGTLTWTNQPTNFMATIKLTFAGTNYQCPMPQLGGQRLSLTFDANGLAQLWQDDSILAQHATSGSSDRTNVTVLIHHPVGRWDFTSNTLNVSNYLDQNVTVSYQRTNATYALLYAFDAALPWLEERQNQLNGYRQQGLADTSRQVLSETLNVMGLNWMLQGQWISQAIAQQMGALPLFRHRFGRMAQEAGHGYYVDVYMQYSTFCPRTGYTAADLSNQDRAEFLSTFFESALEHAVIEQLQGTNLTAASTVKMLEIANTNGQAIYLANSANWSTVQSKLVNYGTALTYIGNLVSSNFSVLLPQNGSNHLAGAGSWAGYAYLARLSNATTVAEDFTIGGGYQGGYIESPTATADTPYVTQVGQAQPTAFGASSALPAAPTGADPVDLADAAFQVEANDLSLGQAEPRGINFSRYYNTKRRYANSAGMAGGWVHNYAVAATECCAAQAGLGQTTPAQMAPLIAASCAAASLFNSGSPDAKNWTVTTLIAKWAIDQLIKNGVSVSLGKDTLQFVKQPDGSFTPPANCTWSLSKSAG